MPYLPGMTLRASITQTIAGTRTTELANAVDALITRYRSGIPAGSAILSREIDVLAYTAYRMPATYAATRAVFEQLHVVVPDLRPRNLVDFGAGTGATAWAALDVWPDLTSLTMLEQSDAAIAVGRRIAENSHSTPLRAASWRQWHLGQTEPLDPADIAVAAYVLGELTTEQQSLLVETLVHTASTVVLVEPGTPAGFARIITARNDLIARGLSVLAPCPHAAQCPLLARDGDWCHFAERLERSSTHRSVKSAELSYEDEKYAYVAASRTALPSGASGRRPARILRHPTMRKGLVSLQLCTEEGNAVELKVAKSEGEPYKQARHARWGDPWPPPEHPEG
jgi:ribosomal protein RSM22 (predicted rRNA methylase)